MQKLPFCFLLLLVSACFHKHARVILKPIYSIDNVSFLYGKYYVDAATLAANENLNEKGSIYFTLNSDSTFAAANFPECMLASSKENHSIQAEGKWKTGQSVQGNAIEVELSVNRTIPDIKLSGNSLFGNLYLQNDSVPVIVVKYGDEKKLKFTKNL